MCGICGIFRLDAGAPPPDREELRRTRDRMAARGPDGSGEWFDGRSRIALGHRRLAILDLSPAGAQPMASGSGRYRIVFNGEIYNFRELRGELERDGIRFRTTSDTEVLLALWERDGEAALARLRGMFALAIWDERDGRLTLARDSFGIKPLYYSTRGGLFRFASQVRAFEATATAGGAVDPAALVGFLLWGSVPEPWTWRSDVRALPAGHLLRVDASGVGSALPLPFLDHESESEPADPGEALAASVRAHLVSDVPVALFLSAGLDSTLIGALARREMAPALTTFTLAFAGWTSAEGDEAALARRVAASLGSRHVERRLTREEVAAAWPQVLAAMDQPSIDGFNTFLVARAAHEAGIKVALSGVGGDELAGSYPSFRDVPRWRSRARALRRLPGARSLWPALARRARPGQPKLAGLLDHATTLGGAYFLRRGLFLPEELPALLGREVATEGLAACAPLALAAAALARRRSWTRDGIAGESDDAADDWRSVQRLEAHLYLQNQLLRDTDWAAMASSVEVRVPLVDDRLWRQLARRDFEPARSRGKAALVRAVAPELPAELFARPKSGFTVPVAEWICPPARGEAATPGGGSRRLAKRIASELGACLAR